MVFGRILQLALKQHVHAVLSGVGPEDQRHPQCGIGTDGLFLLLQDIQLAFGVNEISSFIEHNGYRYNLDCKGFHLGPQRADPPRPVVPRGWWPRAVGQRVQEGGGAMVGREGRPGAQVGLQERVGKLAGLGVEQQWPTDAGRRRAEVGPPMGRLRLAQIQGALLPPVEDRRIVTRWHSLGWE